MTVSAPAPHRNTPVTDLKQLGIAYCKQLMRVGIPKEDAKKIAAAIAKFDTAKRLPSEEQKQLINHFSPSICRARLWRSHLL